jgi:hypothetical protein
MKRRILMPFGMLLCSFLSAQAPTAAPTPAAVAPEPAALPLMGTGLSVFLAGFLWRRSRSKRRDS